jgi:hypothetical protein
LSNALVDLSVGFGLTDIRSNAAGTAHTFYSAIDHGLAGITSVSIVSAGFGYGSGAAGNIYNARLVGFAGSTTGENATAVITFDGSGTITAVKIMDGGSAYGIGNTLSIVGVATTTSHVPAVVQVTHINDNINDSIQLDGITPDSNNEYNTLYKITGISTGNTKQFEVESSVAINNPTQTGLGVTDTSSSNTKIVGKALGISTFTYSPTSGIATVTFNGSHGFKVDNKLRISGSDTSLFNGDFIVKKVNALTSLSVNVGLGTDVVGTGGSITVYRYGFASGGGDITRDKENISGRFNFEYAGITTTLNTSILANAIDSTPLVIIGANTLGFKLGDYIQIDNEIFRIKTDVTGSSVSVFRGLFGTPRETHVTNSVVRRVNVIPVELRRNSIIRASGHTFEYLGFGPGNYSTAFPERQDRVISPQEELVAQNSKVDGGISIFTAMNSDGDFYTGNKKVNSATGQEEVFDTPVPTVTGEEIDDSAGFDVQTSMEVSVSRSLRVEGGPDRNLVSEFDGPVLFNHKLTSTSENGIEATSVFLQGEEEVSRKFNISKDKPSLAGNYGDISFNSEPTKNGFVGWAYVTQNQWEPFGFIGGNGVGISSNGYYVGFSTLVNIETDGIILTAENDDPSGVTTVRFDANPRIGISSGTLNEFVGLATQINFVGYGITLTTAFNETAGVATVTVDTSGLIGLGGSFPGLPNFSIQHNSSGVFAGTPIFLYNPSGNNLIVEGSSNNTIFKVTQTGNGDSFYVEDTSGDPTPFVINNAGLVGIGSSVPTAQVDIDTSQQAINIRSTNGSGNIIRVDSAFTDDTPFIVDVNGNVGINTGSAVAPLDVVGNAAITGSVRIYEADRSNYVGLQVGSLSSDLTFTLPTGIGTAGYVLFTSGGGVLDWKSVSNQEVVAGTGITITYSTVGSGITVATIGNSGVRRIIAGLGVSVSPASGTGEVTISASDGGVANIYPFTTRGFSIPI